MISAWKRLINKTDPNNSTTNGSSNSHNGTPPGIHKLDKQLQRKFAHGVNYNLKIIIKGDARVGKTALFRRLEGHDFEENYPPTENLTVTSINWNYKASDDIVKIDLWEAIDPIWRKSNVPTDLKLDNQNNNNANNHQHQNETQNRNNSISQARLVLNNSISPIPEEAKQSLAQLSENMDVYKGADAVLIVFDMTKLWTYKYAQAEIVKVPHHIPILLIANHRDQGHHRTVSTEQAESFVEGLEREPGDAIVMYTEASMKNSFGLNMIGKFFNIPFLKLQEASLLKQLELNRCDFMNTLEELELMAESMDREYENYLKLRTQIKRQEADAMSPVNSGLIKLDDNTRERIRNATMSSSEIGIDLNQIKSIQSSNSNDDKSRAAAQAFAENKFVNDRLPSIVMGAKCSLPETKKIIMNRIDSPNNGNNNINDDVMNNDQCSDDSDDSDEPTRANPLVANYQSDLDSDDQVGGGN